MLLLSPKLPEKANFLETREPKTFGTGPHASFSRWFWLLLDLIFFNDESVRAPDVFACFVDLLIWRH